MEAISKVLSSQSANPTEKGWRHIPGDCNLGKKDIEEYGKLAERCPHTMKEI
jgi:hypothetical protein